MTVVGIIFSNIHDKNVPELTRRRTMASIPFGSRYRLIDFTLSNMVNSDITHVGVITHYNYQSLMDHIGSGKDWDLARRSGGIKLLPPYITAFANSANSLYSTRLEALHSIIEFINDCREEYVVLSDCDVVCNIDLRDILNRHIESGADMTIAVKKKLMTEESSKKYTIINSDDAGRITDVVSYSSGDLRGLHDVNLNIWVLKRKYLLDLLIDSNAHGYTSFTKDIIGRNIGKADIRVYRYGGYFASINSLSDYFMYNMDLLNANVREELFGVKNRPILTKIRNSAPTNYRDGSFVNNSLIAAGCVIEGKVENSILFRGVKVSRGSVVRNSILMQDTLVGENVELNCVISDKNVVIRDGITLSGAGSMPFYIDKMSIIY